MFIAVQTNLQYYIHFIFDKDSFLIQAWWFGLRVREGVNELNNELKLLFRNIGEIRLCRKKWNIGINLNCYPITSLSYEVFFIYHNFHLVRAVAGFEPST